jgi:hypothetical protein
MDYIKALNKDIEGKFVEKFNVKEHSTMKIYKVMTYELYYINKERKSTLIYSNSITDRIPDDKKDAFKDKMREQYLSTIFKEHYKDLNNGV